MKKSRLAAALMSALFLLPIASGCNENAEKHSTRELFAMDTVMSLSAYGERCEEATLAAEEEIKRLDALLSTGSSDSETGRINSGETVTMSDDTASLFSRSVEIYEMTGGAYDMSLYPLTVLWGFCGDNPAVPDEESIKKTMLLCGSDKIKSDGSTLTLSEGQGIDFGGIAKGYIGDKMTEVLESKGVVSAVINLGGNVICIGGKTDEDDFVIGVETPFSDRKEITGKINARDKTLVTSGVYERRIEVDGKTYHHILDTKTGWPAETDLDAVTLTADKGHSGDIDALSTICLIKGYEAASKLIEVTDGVEAVFILKDGTTEQTSGMEFEKV